MTKYLFVHVWLLKMFRYVLKICSNFVFFYCTLFEMASYLANSVLKTVLQIQFWRKILQTHFFCFPETKRNVFLFFFFFCFPETKWNVSISLCLICYILWLTNNQHMSLWPKKGTKIIFTWAKMILLAFPFCKRDFN
jgi:hypothetical protein